MAKPVTYEVGVTFCTGRVIIHKVEDLGGATEEYSWMLAAAIDPSIMNHTHVKHIRQVTLTGFDELGLPTVLDTSPVYVCEHQPANDAA